MQSIQLYIFQQNRFHVLWSFRDQLLELELRINKILNLRNCGTRRRSVMRFFRRIISESYNVASAAISQHVIDLPFGEIKIFILVSLRHSVHFFRLHHQKSCIRRVSVGAPLTQPKKTFKAGKFKNLF